MVTLEAILDIVPVVGVIIALVYYTLTIRSQTRTRQAQLYMQFLNPFITGEKSKVWDKLREWEFSDYDDFMQNYWSKSENRDAFRSLSGYFEGLGVYVREGLVPIRLVALTMTSLLTRFGISSVLLSWRLGLEIMCLGISARQSISTKS